MCMHMYMYMHFLYMYVYVHVYVFVYVPVCVYVYVYAYVHACFYVYIYVYKAKRLLILPLSRSFMTSIVPFFSSGPRSPGFCGVEKGCSTSETGVHTSCRFRRDASLLRGLPPDGCQRLNESAECCRTIVEQLNLSHVQHCRTAVFCLPTMHCCWLASVWKRLPKK